MIKGNHNMLDRVLINKDSPLVLVSGAEASF